MSFAVEMMRADQAIRQRQQEEEDRQFELLKRQHEQAKMDEEAYMRPFARKEAEAQYKDAEITRQEAEKTRGKAEEAERLQNWITPFQPKLGANADGTRSMDIQTPMVPALAGAFAAGLGTMGNDIGGFMRPFEDQVLVNSRTYNTPDGLVKKAQQETEHKRRLELENTKAANRASNKSSKTGIASKSTRQNPADTRFYKDLDSAMELAVGNFYKQNNKKIPTQEELLVIKAEVAKTMLSHPLYSGVSPEIKQAFAPQSAPQSAPQQKPVATKPAQKPATKAAPISDPATEDAVWKDFEQQMNPQPKTVNLQEKQGSNAAIIPAPTLQTAAVSPSAAPTTPKASETDLLLKEKAKIEAELMSFANRQPQLSDAMTIRMLQERLKKITDLLSGKPIPTIPSPGNAMATDWMMK